MKAPATLTPVTPDDFIPFPMKRLAYRGLNLSRSSLLRLRDAKQIRVASFSVTGGRQRRVMIIRESLDAWIERQLKESGERLPAA
jgi:hypothetical protein